MTQLKYKVGDVVRFTLQNGRPSSTDWLEGAKEGEGVVIEDILDAVTESYPVKVTNLPDWEGHDCHGRLKGPNKRKGWFFLERSLRLAETAQTSTTSTKPITREKSGDDGTRAWFMQTKEDPAVHCPNPACNGAETERIFFSVVCPICGWTSH